MGSTETVVVCLVEFLVMTGLITTTSCASREWIMSHVSIGFLEQRIALKFYPDSRKKITLTCGV